MIALSLNRKPLIAVAATIAVATAIIGWMHTPGARPILRRLGIPCPVNSVTSEQVSHLREIGLSGMRGPAPAPARPALGMILDGTTEKEAMAWATANAVQCDSVVHGYRFLRCRGFPAKALGAGGPAVSELWLSFGTAGTLIGVDVYRRGLDEPGERAVWAEATGKLKSQLGDPAVHFGDPAPSSLLATSLQSARVQYRYSDYVATVTAVNLPHAGLAVREQYLSGTKSM